MSYLTHLESCPDGEKMPASVPRNGSGRRGTLLLARYDLARIRREVTPSDVAVGPPSLWRYAALLPVENPVTAVTLNEGFTPLVRCDRLASSIGCGNLWIKDEGRNPSGTFKDRGAAVAVSRYRELGIRTVALNSSGNAGASWAMYTARAGLECVNVLPTDVQASSLAQCLAAGARSYLLDDWHVSGKVVADACAAHGWFDVCTLREPYRMEGKKTMGMEVAEQLGWSLPDAIVYPMGGGLGPIAIWKAFEELLELGWVAGKMPRLFVTQYSGCAPVVKAFEAGMSHVEPWGKIDIPPGGLKSPNPPGGQAVLSLIRKYGGAAIAVSVDEANNEVKSLASQEGIFACPESATTVAGLIKALRQGLVMPDERIVIICTGSGLKSIPSAPAGRIKRISNAMGIDTA
jgi:threonine synthase